MLDVSYFKEPSFAERMCGGYVMCYMWRTEHSTRHILDLADIQGGVSQVWPIATILYMDDHIFICDVESDFCVPHRIRMLIYIQ